MHKNFTNAISEDHSVLLSAAQKTRGRVCKAEDYTTAEVYEFTPFLTDINLLSKANFS